MCSLSHSTSLRAEKAKSSDSCSQNCVTCSLSTPSHCAEPTGTWPFTRTAAIVVFVVVRRAHYECCRLKLGDHDHRGDRILRAQLDLVSKGAASSSEAVVDETVEWPTHCLLGDLR